MPRRSAAPTAKAISFFYRHAGYTARSGESRVEARKRSARSLARAEAEASARGWRVDWEGDPDDSGEAEEVFGAVLRDDRGHVLASLWGIGDPTREKRRVVEAELAREALKGS